jgi:hypothetical protein
MGLEAPAAFACRHGRTRSKLLLTPPSRPPAILARHVDHSPSDVSEHLAVLPTPGLYERIPRHQLASVVAPNPATAAR